MVPPRQISWQPGFQSALEPTVVGQSNIVRDALIVVDCHGSDSLLIEPALLAGSVEFQGTVRAGGVGA